MASSIPPLAAYNDGYQDIDRAAALALRIPLITQLAAMPAPDRAPWLAGLLAGLSEGLCLDSSIEPDGDAHLLGQRMHLLLFEEGVI